MIGLLAAVWTWLRVVLPPMWVIVLLAIVYGLINAVHFGSELFGFRANSHDFHELCLMLISFAALAYGVFRAIVFHPFWRLAYREWLLGTPWEHPQPLPLGPVHLVWQDLVVVGTLALLVTLHSNLSASDHFAVAALIFTFLLAYLIPLTPTFTMEGSQHFGYAIAFGLALVIRTMSFVWLSLPIAVAVYLLAWVGLSKALGRFQEWNLDWFAERGLVFKSYDDLQEQARQKLLGWPFDRVSPKKSPLRISYRHGLLLGLLIGCIVWAVIGVTHDAMFHRDVMTSLCSWPDVTHGDPKMTVMFHMLVSAVILASVSRVFVYCWGYLPPLNLFGRLMRFRWVIPGYDLVIVTPLCAVLVARFLPPWLLEMGWPVEYLVPLTVTLCALILINVGPSVERWQLTGNHRVVPGMMLQQMSQEVTRV